MTATNEQPFKSQRLNVDPKIALIGKKKKIIVGQWKGYEGIIKQITNNKAQFELSARAKVILIPLNQLNIEQSELQGMCIGT